MRLNTFGAYIPAIHQNCNDSAAVWLSLSYQTHVPTTWARWVDSKANSNGTTDGDNCFQHLVQGWEIKQRNSGQQRECACSNVHNVTTNALTDSEQQGHLCRREGSFGTPAVLEGFLKKLTSRVRQCFKTLLARFSVKRSLLLCLCPNMASKSIANDFKLFSVLKLFGAPTLYRGLFVSHTEHIGLASCQSVVSSHERQRRPQPLPITVEDISANVQLFLSPSQFVLWHMYCAMKHVAIPKWTS